MLTVFLVHIIGEEHLMSKVITLVNNFECECKLGKFHQHC